MNSLNSLAETALPTDRQQPFVLVPQYFGSLVFDRVAVRYIPFDDEATGMLRLLVDRSIHDLIADANSQSDRDQLEKFYFHLERFGLFDHNGFSQIETIQNTAPADFLAAPLVTHVEVIGACNITCTHCFAGELPRNQNPLSLDELDRLFGELASLGCFRVSLTGGEPLMRADIFEIVDSAQCHGLAVAIATNATMIDESMAIELGKRKSLRLTVSLDGATAQSNDAIRGEGVFKQVCERIEILRRHADFSISFTITKGIAEEVDECVQLAQKLGASAAVFRPLFPTGTALNHPELMPSFREYTDAINRVSSGTTLEEDVTELESQCGAGELLASISVQGDVNPCSFLGSDFASGNIRTSSFKQIWNDGHQFKRLRSFDGRSDEDSSGDQCDSHFVGGCRCRSIAATGDVNGADPWHSQYKASPQEFFFPLKNLVAKS